MQSRPFWGPRVTPKTGQWPLEGQSLERAVLPLLLEAASVVAQVEMTLIQDIPGQGGAGSNQM